MTQRPDRAQAKRFANILRRELNEMNERFKYEYQVLSRFDVGWARRRVRWTRRCLQ